MKIRVYKVRSDGSDVLSNSLKPFQYQNYNTARALVKSEVDKYIESLKKKSDHRVVHICEREDDVCGYRVQIVVDYKNWYYIVTARVEPSWVIIKDE